MLNEFMQPKEPLIPVIGEVTDIRIDTPDVKTFRALFSPLLRPSHSIPLAPVWTQRLYRLQILFSPS